MIYFGLAISLLVGISRDSDPEAVTVGWLIVAAPWIWTGVFGEHYWLAVPLNAMTLYVLLLSGSAIYRTLRRFFGE